MIVFRGLRYIAAGRVFRSGDVLPDTPYSRSLVEKGIAEIINDTPTVKPAKKSKQEAITDTAQANDKGNS